jgi:hypothetical protein
LVFKQQWQELNDFTSNGNGMISGRIHVFATSDFGLGQTAGAEIAGEFGRARTPWATLVSTPQVGLIHQSQKRQFLR